MRAWPVLLLAACAGEQSGSDGTVLRDYSGGVSIGDRYTDVLSAHGRPDRIDYPGPNIEEWIYVSEKQAPRRDDTIDPNPFPKEVVNVNTHRTIYRFENRYVTQIIELQPGEARKEAPR
jgi:hypothetical protein